jgi:hypothetical protein
METDRAKEILLALADGRDPATGEQFPPNSPYQQADTVRALHMALEAMERGGRARAPRVIDPNRPKAGGPWTPEEEHRLCDAFTVQKPVPEIAAAHGRTPGAITSRLVKLGLITDTATNRAGAGNRPPGQAGSPIRLPRRSPERTETGPTPPSLDLTPPPLELTEEEKDNLPF